MRIRELIDTLGDLLEATVASAAALDREPLRIVVPEDPSDVLDGDLAVLPPLPGDAASPRIDEIRALAAQGAAAVVVKGTPSVARSLTSVEIGDDVAVLVLSRDAAWQAAFQRISTAFDGGGAGAGDDFVGDLFALAEATSMALRGAVAIMNDYMQIVAYSSQPGQPTDQTRRDGILGRRVPAAMVSSHIAVRTWPAGTVRRDKTPGNLPRLVAPVRVGDKYLGSIWVILPSDEITDDMRSALAASARVAAVHLMRYSSTRSSGAWRVNQSFIRGRLLGLPAHTAGARPSVIVLAALPCGDMAAEEELLREQLASIVSLTVAGWEGGGCTIIDDVVYALLPVDAASPVDAGSLADAVIRRAQESLHQDVAIGLSAPVDDAPTAREQSLAAAGWQRARGAGRADFPKVQTELWLDGVGAAMSAAGASPSIAAELTAYDAEHGTEYAASVLSYLEHSENVAAAAAELRLHPNSLRYRLRRATELFDIDLTRPDGRLAAWLSLRLHRR